MKTTLIITRHGQTIWNVQKKLQGQTDIPLNETGIAQARELANLLKQHAIDQIYTSILTRAIDTGKIVADTLGLSLTQHSGLNERNYGEYEGKSWEQTDKDLAKEGGLRHITPKGGESAEAVKNRVVKTIFEIAKKHRGQTILIVTHGGVIHTLVRHIRNVPVHEELYIHFANTSISIFHVHDDNTIKEHSLGQTE